MEYVGSNGTTIYFAWNGDAVIAEYTEPSGQSALNWSKSYVYLGGRLLATETGAATHFHHPDRLGTRFVTNAANSNTIAEQTTLPFGRALDAESSGAVTNRRFTSYDRSAETKLDYAVNRFYNAAQGRFTQADPIGMKASNLQDPQSLNLYGYVGNDPINLTDPDGLFWKAIGRFFKSIGKFFSAIAKAVLRVLNNKWVSLGVTILGALAGIGFLGKVAQHLKLTKLLSKAASKAISTAVAYYQKARNLASYLAMAGEALQGQFKEIVLGLAGAIPAIIQESIEYGLMESFKNVNWKNPLDVLKAGWSGFKNGLRDGWKRIKIIFTRPLKDLFVPVYGFFCGPGYGYDSSGHDT